MVAAAGFLGHAAPAAADVFPVTKTTDDAGPCLIGDCSLRAAVIAANTNPGADRIFVPSGAYTLTIDDAPGVPEFETGDLDIVDDVTIVGAPDTRPVIDGLNEQRVFDIPYNGVSVRAHLRNLRLENGSAADGTVGGGLRIGAPGDFVLANSAVTGNQFGGIRIEEGLANVVIRGSDVSANAGGGIIFAGTLAVLDSQVIGNTPTFTGFGGIIGTGRLTVGRTTIDGNGSSSFGGGIDIAAGELVVRDSRIVFNTSGDNGGGIHVGGEATGQVFGTTLSQNDANLSGGGIRLDAGGSLTVESSGIEANTASNGGGIATAGALVVHNSTISGNTVPSRGGGLLIEDSGSAQLKSVTLARNIGELGAGIEAGGALSWGYTVAGDNFGGSDCRAAGGSFSEIGPNHQEIGDCTDPSGDPMLEVLADNGGPSATHRPSDGSPLIDAVLDHSCSDFDQRGAFRGSGPCTLGALENGADLDADVSVEKTDSADPVAPETEWQYTLTVRGSGPGRAWGVILRDRIPLALDVVSVSGPDSCDVSDPESEVPNVLECPLGTLAPEDSATIVVTVAAPSSGSVENRASVTSSSTDPVGANDEDVETTDVGGGDTTPPDTRITAGPADEEITGDSVTFAFDALAELGVTFECTLDGSPQVVCTSPHTLGLGDGHHVFTVAARDASNNLDPTPATRSWTVYTGNGVLPAGTTRVSTSATGDQQDDAGGRPAISADGRFVAFQSNASNLVDGVHNAVAQVYVKDRLTGAIELVSRAVDGTRGNDLSYDASISADGRYVTFGSAATNLVAGDVNGLADVFVYDTQTNTTEIVSVDSGENQAAGGGSFNPDISEDGRYVAFHSDADSFIAGDTNERGDIFVRDRVAGTTVRVSVNSAGGQSNAGSFFPSISPDGDYVAFESPATNLAPDTNPGTDVFLHRRSTGETQVVSLTDDERPANGNSVTADVSRDGHDVAFQSDALNLIGDAAVGIVIRNVADGTTTLVEQEAIHPVLTSDGRYVAYKKGLQIQVEDWRVRCDGAPCTIPRTEVVSIDAAGDPGLGDSTQPAISDTGPFVAFDSLAPNLVAGDTNGATDVFARGPVLDIVVTTTADSGPGSLRAAIDEANDAVGDDTIRFAIDGPGPHVIAPATPLPQAFDVVDVDGTTQPGYVGTPRIELDGSLTDGGVGLLLNSPGGSVHGLAIHSFGLFNLWLVGSNHAVVDSYIGLRADGTPGAGGGIGIEDYSSNSLIANNVVSGNETGLRITQSFDGAGNGTTVRGNRIGTNLSGDAAVPNGVGILVQDVPDVVVGGPAGADGNVIAGNTGDGLAVTGSAARRTIIGANKIGVGAGGGALANGGDGIRFSSGASSNSVGGASAASANTIANNAGAGVALIGMQANAPIRNSITHNSIHSNGGLAIDLGSDGPTGNAPPGIVAEPNEGLDHPVLTSIGAVPGQFFVEGSVTDITLGARMRIEVYASDGCHASGRGDLRELIGTFEGVFDGDSTFVVFIDRQPADGEVLSATVTASDNTSEPSPCFGGAPPLSVTASLTSPASGSAGFARIPYSSISPSAVLQTAAGAEAPADATATATTETGEQARTRSAPMNDIPMNDINLAESPMNDIPMNDIGLGGLLDTRLGDLPLSAIPISTPGGWTGQLAGGPYANAPLHTVTLREAYRATPRPAVLTIGDPNELTLGQIQSAGTILGRLPVHALALGAAPLNDIPLNDIGTATPDVLERWCLALAGPPVNCTDPTTLQGETVVSLGLMGAPLNDIPMNDIPMNDIDLTHSPMNDIPMNDIDLSFSPMNDIPLNDILVAGSPMNDIPMNDILLAGSPMNDIPMNDIPLNDIAKLVDCTLYDCSSGTLGDAFAAGALRPGATLGDLAGALTGFTLGDLGAFGDVTLGELAPFLPEGITLAHVILALVSPDAIAWEEASLPTLLAASTPAEGGATTYTLSFTLNGGSPGAALGALVELDLPEGFAPQSDAQLSASTAVAVAGDVTASDVSFTLTGLEAGTPYTLEVPARPGSKLGPTSATAKITPTGGAASPTLSAPLTVTETLEPNDDPNSPQALRSDSLYINYLSSGTDADYFSYTAAPNRRIVFRGGQLPVDADFVVYGPPGSSPGSPFPDGPNLDGLPLADDGVELDVARQTLAPETLDDVDILAGRPLLALSINRGTEDEAAVVLSGPTGGTFLLQVRGYNRGFSALPMMLRVQDQPSGDQLECGPRQFPFAGTPGAAPTLPTGLNTLFLVNYARLEATYGTAEADKVRNALGAQALADLAALGYPSAVLPVESDTGVSAAYTTWDQAPCSTERANNVVTEITRLVAETRAQRPGLRYVVLVGGDDIVPHRRIDDFVTIANERDYATSVDGENQFKAALLARKVLTDDSYVDVNPVPFMGRKLYVPDLAVGRLVERPDEIAGAIARFRQFNGTLDPQTAVTMGYDFLEDGSQAIFGSLTSLVPPGNSAQDINANWTAADMASRLFGGNGADLASLNAHYDDHRALPADQNATGTQNDLFTTAALRDPVNAAKLTRALVFSMGCHSGYSPTDILLGTTAPVDWAQAHGEQGSAGFVGNTGYGYGDTDVVGYTEKLMAIFAEELARTPTVAEALNRAKRRYIGLQSVVGVYDEKAAAELTFYGLPMYELPGATSPAPTPEPPTEPEPITGLQASSFSVQPAFSAPQSGDNGDYFTVAGGDIEAKHHRPLQPRLQLPAPDAAKGALITELESTDANDAFDPASSRPIVDDSSSERGTDAGDSVYPAKIQAVTDTVDPDGTPGRALVLVPAQFFTDEDPATRPGLGVERLFTRIEGLIYTSASDRSTAPVFRLIDAVQLEGRIAFTIEVDDPGAADPAAGVLRNYVLVHDNDGWKGLDLVRTPGTSTWTGSMAVNGENVEYFVQAVGVGGVAVSTRKGRYFEARPAEQAPPDLGATVTGPEGNGGWFRGPATVALGGDGPFQVSVDGAPAETYDDPFAVAGDGVHRVTVSRPGADPAELTIRIDATPPTAVIAAPAEGATFGVGEDVPADYVCLDAGSGVVACEGTVAVGAPIDTGSRGAKSFSVTATDVAGNPAAVVTSHYTVNRAPTAPGAPVAEPTPNGGVFMLSWTPATDADDDPLTYTLEHKDADDAGFTQVATGLTSATFAFTAAAPEAEGTQVYRVRASDGGESGPFSAASAPVVVDKTAPNVPLLQADRAPDFAGAGGWYKPPVTVTTAPQGDPPLADGSPGSGVALVSPPQSVTTTSTQPITGAVVDAAGNSSEGALALQVDGDEPLVAVTCPTGPVLLGGGGTASWTATDLHSGLATPASGTVALDTSTVGTKIATSPTAADNVGNTQVATCTYAVVFDFAGFFRPVDNPPTLNLVSAGRAVPVRFTLGGYQGLGILAAGYPRSQQISCSATAPVDGVEETITAGSSSLQWDGSQYVYVWKTERSWIGTCRQFVLRLVDGTTDWANFKFTR